MNSAEILSAQIARQITEQRKLVIRFQHPMPGPAFNHPKVGAEWIGFTLQNRRLRGSFSKAGRELSTDEIESLFAMVPNDKIDFGDEADFFAQYANRTQFNTDPQILCWPAQAILGGMNIAQQVDEFLRRFVE